MYLTFFIYILNLKHVLSRVQVGMWMLSDAAQRMIEMYIQISAEYRKNLQVAHDFPNKPIDLVYHINMMQKTMRGCQDYA